jgi:Zn-dependent metalloprotease
MSVKAASSSLADREFAEKFCKVAKQVRFIKSVDEVVSAYISITATEIDKISKSAGRLFWKTLCCDYTSEKTKVPAKKASVTHLPSVKQKVSPPVKEGHTVSVRLDDFHEGMCVHLYASKILTLQNPRDIIKCYKSLAIREDGSLKDLSLASSKLSEMYQKGGLRENATLARYWENVSKNGGHIDGAQLKILGSSRKKRFKIYDCTGLQEDKVMEKMENKRLIPEARRTPKVDKCLENMQKTDAFFKEKFQTELLPLEAYIYIDKYKNGAAWNDGLNAACYGNVAKPIRTRFLTLETVAHEHTHGLIQHTCDLTYRDESGALNESLADVFGMMTKQSSEMQPKRANDPNCDWLFGAGYHGEGTYLRSFSDKPSELLLRQQNKLQDQQNKNKPTKSDLPSTMDDFFPMEADNGGVHFYSSIGNRAFFIAARDDGNFSWEKIGQIWFRAMLITEPNDGFAEFAQNTMIAARAYGEGVEQIVAKAWNTVEVFEQNKRTYRRTLPLKAI